MQGRGASFGAASASCCWLRMLSAGVLPGARDFLQAGTASRTWPLTCEVEASKGWCLRESIWLLGSGELYLLASAAQWPRAHIRVLDVMGLCLSVFPFLERCIWLLRPGLSVLDFFFNSTKCFCPAVFWLLIRCKEMVGLSMKLWGAIFVPCCQRKKVSSYEASW